MNMNIWASAKFSDLFREPLRNGVYKSKEFHGRGQKVINMGELFAHDFISDQEMKRVALNDRERSTSLVEDGDLLFARRSLVLEGSGKCALVECPPEETTFESSIIRARLDKPRANPRYFYYFFRSPQGRGLIASIATRTAVSGITGSDLAQLIVPVPPLNVQCEIASILSTYDALIENNTRRIKILIEMARRIYREWFVEFRFPGHEKVRMVESELGSIPQEWSVQRVFNFGTVVTGKTPSTTHPEFFGNDVPFIKTPDMHGNFFCVEVADHLSLIGAESQNNKTIPANSVIVNCIGALAGSVSITTKPAQTNQQINSVVLKSESSREFLYLSLLGLRETLRSIGSNGATMINVNKNKFENLEVKTPTPDLLGQFHDVAFPMFELIRSLQTQDVNLRATRDLLLPKLISGEIPVEASEDSAAELAAQTA